MTSANAGGTYDVMKSHLRLAGSSVSESIRSLMGKPSSINK